MKMSLVPAVALAAVPMLLVLGAGRASAQRASGNPPPPKGFEVASASFVSARTGFVLGARKCSRLPCPARLEKTVDGGKTWQTKTYLDAGLGFRDLAYISASTGYLVHFSGGPVLAYGRGLMKTVNAGASWRTMPIP